LPVRLSEASVLAPKSATFFLECIVSLSGPGNIGIERLQESLFTEYTLTDFEFLIELPAGRGSISGSIRGRSRLVVAVVAVMVVVVMMGLTNFEFFVELPAGRWSICGGIRGRSRLVVAVVAVMMVVVVMGLTNFELFVELPASRWCIAGGVRGGSRLVVAVVTVMVVVVMMGLSGLEGFTTFTNGLRNDRCNGSSSENECNGKLDLDHFD